MTSATATAETFDPAATMGLPERSGRAWIWWCQAVRSAKARVTAAVRLETCSRR